MKEVSSLLLLFLFGLVFCGSLCAMAAGVGPASYQNKSWQMFQKDVTHIGVNDEYDATNARDILENYTGTCGIEGTPTTVTGADVDSDGYVELVYGCANEGVIRAIKYGRGWSLGNFSTLDPSREFSSSNGFVSSPVTIYDIDGRMGHEGLEMVYGTSSGYLTVLDAKFSEIASVHACKGAIYSAPSISDIDGDDKPDIIFSCTDGKVYRYSYSDGSLSLKETASLGNVSAGASMEASQTIAYHEGYKVVALAGNRLFVLGPALDVLASESLEGSQGMDKSTPIAKDINSDGRLEVIVAFGSKIYCFAYDDASSKLTERWEYETSAGLPINPEEGFGEAIATNAGNIVNAMYAAETLDVVSLQYPTRCVLNPASASLQTGGTQRFAATCYNNATVLDCPALAWSTSSASLGSMNASYTPAGANSTSVFQAGSSAGSGWVETRLNSSFYCRANVTITSPSGSMGVAIPEDNTIPKTYPYRCALSPNYENVKVGGTQTITATCWDNAGGSTNCPRLSWSTSSASLGSVSPSSTFPSLHPQAVFKGLSLGNGWVEASSSAPFNSCRSYTNVTNFSFSVGSPNIIGTPLISNTRRLLGGSEIVFADENGDIYMIDSGGNLLWEENYGFGNITASPVMSKNEIVFQGANGVFAVDFEGNLLWHDNGAKGSLTPSLVDVNGDGLLEVVSANSGNDDVVVYGDATPPAINSVNANAVALGGMATISANVSDSNSGVKNVEATVEATTIELAFDNESGLWDGTMDAPSSAGEYGITVKAWDDADNGPAIDNGSSLDVYSSGGGDEDKDFRVDVKTGCAKEPVNITVTYHNKGVSGASVKLLYRQDSSHVTNVGENETDSKGNATLITPFEGNYELTVKRTGYNMVTKTFSINCTFEPTPPENETYHVRWLLVGDKTLQPGKNNSITASVKNEGNKSAYSISFSVSNCPVGWSCGITPAFASSLGANETLEVKPWFVVPANESMDEIYLLLKLAVGQGSDYESFKATINVTQKNGTDEEMKKAYEGINSAVDEIEKANSDGKDVTNATNKLAEAQDAYAKGDYQTAYLLSTEAEELAKNAPEKGGGSNGGTALQLDSNTLMIGGAAVAVVIVLAIAAYFMFFRKGGEEVKKPEEVKE